MQQKIEEYNVDPRYIYNIDEKGFLISILLKQKRIFSRRLYKEGGIKQMI